jgi:hypothetical protein
MQRFQQFDAATGLGFLIPQLAHIEKKLYEKKYADLNYQKVLPISTEAGEHATSIVYFFMDAKTIAKFVGTKSLDVPLAEIGEGKLTVPVELGAIGYTYSDEELRQAMYLGRALPQLKADQARRGYEELAQRTSMTGDTSHALPGFINNVNITGASVVDPGSGTEFVNKTPEQILFDINDFMGDIFVDTKQIERPNTLLLPTAQWNYIASTPRQYTDMSILKWLIANSPYLTSENDIMPIVELVGAGAGGTDRMIAYNKDPDKLIFHIPMPLKFTQPQREGLGWLVPGQFKLSGTEIRYPGSVRYADGI